MDVNSNYLKTALNKKKVYCKMSDKFSSNRLCSSATHVVKCHEKLQKEVKSMTTELYHDVYVKAYNREDKDREYHS